MELANEVARPKAPVELQNQAIQAYNHRSEPVDRIVRDDDGRLYLEDAFSPASVHEAEGYLQGYCDRALEERKRAQHNQAVNDAEPLAQAMAGVDMINKALGLEDTPYPRNQLRGEEP